MNIDNISELGQDQLGNEGYGMIGNARMVNMLKTIMLQGKPNNDYESSVDIDTINDTLSNISGEDDYNVDQDQLGNEGYGMIGNARMVNMLKTIMLQGKPNNE
jgi:hypothetical protein